MNLQAGVKGAEVGNWQRFLVEHGAGKLALVVDEDFGPATQNATEEYQAQKGLLASGVVDAVTYAASIQDGFIPFIQAKNYTALWPAKRANVDLLVVHTMENVNKPKTALNVGLWFAGSAAPQASAHYGCDESDVIQYVRETDIAWAAPGANRNGIHIEHAGYAKETDADWHSDANLAMLEKSAHLAAAITKRWGIPIVKLSIDELRNSRARGFCGHVDITNARNGGIGHTDPGPNFVWNEYMSRVRGLSA